MRKHVTLAELPELLTPEEARAVLRVGRTAMYAAFRAEQIPAVRVGRQLRIPRVAIERITKGETP